MNRRRLILTTLGTLAGLPFASRFVENVSALPDGYKFGKHTIVTSPETMRAIESLIKPKVSIAELFVSESAVVSGTIAGLGPKQDVPIAELYISVSQDVNEALSKETTVVTNQQPLVMIGSLIVANEAEAEAFLKRMADAIRKASQPGSSRLGASY